MKHLVIVIAIVLSGCTSTTGSIDNGDCLVQCRSSVARDNDGREYCTGWVPKVYMCSNWRVFYSECSPAGRE